MGVCSVHACTVPSRQPNMRKLRVRREARRDRKCVIIQNQHSSVITGSNSLKLLSLICCCNIVLNNMDALDAAFFATLADVEALWRGSPRARQLLITAWCEKLAGEVVNDVWRRNRNAYAELLRLQLLAGELSEPFHTRPKDGPLQQLPLHLWPRKPRKPRSVKPATVGDENHDRSWQPVYEAAGMRGPADGSVDAWEARHRRCFLPADTPALPAAAVSAAVPCPSSWPARYRLPGREVAGRSKSPSGLTPWLTVGELQQRAEHVADKRAAAAEEQRAAVATAVAHANAEAKNKRIHATAVDNLAHAIPQWRALSAETAALLQRPAAEPQSRSRASTATEAADTSSSSGGGSGAEESGAVQGTAPRMVRAYGRMVDASVASAGPSAAPSSSAKANQLQRHRERSRSRSRSRSGSGNSSNRLPQRPQWTSTKQGARRASPGADLLTGGEEAEEEDDGASAIVPSLTSGVQAARDAAKARSDADEAALLARAKQLAAAALAEAEAARGAAEAAGARARQREAETEMLAASQQGLHAAVRAMSAELSGVKQDALAQVLHAREEAAAALSALPHPAAAAATVRLLRSRAEAAAATARAAAMTAPIPPLYAHQPTLVVNGKLQQQHGGGSGGGQLTTGSAQEADEDEEDSGASQLTGSSDEDEEQVISVAQLVGQERQHRAALLSHPAVPQQQQPQPHQHQHTQTGGEAATQGTKASRIGAVISSKHDEEQHSAATASAGALVAPSAPPLQRPMAEPLPLPPSAALAVGEWSVGAYVQDASLGGCRNPPWNVAVVPLVLPQSLPPHLLRAPAAPASASYACSI